MQDLVPSLVQEILPKDWQFPFRIGNSQEYPGVGKSTFIESLAKLLGRQGPSRSLYLLVDPFQSKKTKGAFWENRKPRMEFWLSGLQARNLSGPSPTGSTLGGVSSKTRESVCLGRLNLM